MASIVQEGALSAPKSHGLFQGKKFWLSARVPQRGRCAAHIKANGGTIVSGEIHADLCIVDHLKDNAIPGEKPRYSYEYIDKSVANGVLEDLAAHEVKTAPLSNAARRKGTRRPASATTHGHGQGRVLFTEEDDQILFHALCQPGAKISGYKIYEKMSREHPRHTVHGWRYRWVERYALLNPDPNYWLKKENAKEAAGSEPQPETVTDPISDSEEEAKMLLPKSKSPKRQGKKSSTPAILGPSKKNAIVQDLAVAAKDSSARKEPRPVSKEHRLASRKVKKEGLLNSKEARVGFTSHDDGILKRMAEELVATNDGVARFHAFQALAEKYPHHSIAEWWERWEKHVLPEINRMNVAQNPAQERSSPVAAPPQTEQQTKSTLISSDPPSSPPRPRQARTKPQKAPGSVMPASAMPASAAPPPNVPGSPPLPSEPLRPSSPTPRARVISTAPPAKNPPAATLDGPATRKSNKSVPSAEFRSRWRAERTVQKSKPAPANDAVETLPPPPLPPPPPPPPQVRTGQDTAPTASPAHRRKCSAEDAEQPNQPNQPKHAKGGATQKRKRSSDAEEADKQGKLEKRMRPETAGADDTEDEELRDVRAGTPIRLRLRRRHGAGGRTGTVPSTPEPELQPPPRPRREPSPELGTPDFDLTTAAQPGTPTPDRSRTFVSSSPFQPSSPPSPPADTQLPGSRSASVPASTDGDVNAEGAYLDWLSTHYGLSNEQAVELLVRCSAVPEVAEKVARLGVVAAEAEDPRVWTPEQDEILMRGDGRAIEALAKKKGGGESVYNRLEWLVAWRSWEDGSA